MPHYYIWTIGCQMNKADSEHIAGYLEHIGFRSCPRAGDADVIVLNSCVVRQSAEDRVIHKLDSLKSVGQDKLLALTGCIVDSDIADLKRRFPRVDLFFAPQDFTTLSRFLVKSRLAPEGVDPHSFHAKPKPSTLVNIIQGCNNFCAYCIVPYRRGRERSRPVADIVSEVEELARGGTREAVLLGQNIDSYGHDLPGRPTLAGLLAELSRIDGLVRIRFITSHPRDMSADLIEAVANLGKVCEHLSLPVQAGDDDILRTMKRGYTAEQYRHLVEETRRAVPHIALSTDVIVGFPGESREQFQRTHDLLRELEFDTVHIACYSPREGTLAARRLGDDVPSAEKVERRKSLEELQENVATGINRRLKGHKVEVLVEGRKKGKWWGRTRTDKLVFFEDGTDRFGQLVDVEITHTGPWSLKGRLEAT